MLLHYEIIGDGISIFVEEWDGEEEPMADLLARVGKDVRSFGLLSPRVSDVEVFLRLAQSRCPRIERLDLAELPIPALSKIEVASIPESIKTIVLSASMPEEDATAAEKHFAGRTVLWE
ncbi:MAG: hypothetical protein KDD69_09665 [Bdellovibrionales bacterium]|nr:hypothetical protein [Bdellovibrionales bacterium]